METQELVGRVYRELLPLMEQGDEEGVVRTVARFFVRGLGPDQLFGILARLGSRRYSYERFSESLPRGFAAVNACHTLAKRLSREEGTLALLQAAAVMAQEAGKFTDAPVTPYTDFPQNEPEYLAEALVRATVARNLDRADGALDCLLKQPRGRDWAIDVLLHVGSLDRLDAGQKLIMAVHLVEAAAKLKWEIAFGMLRTVTHALASCQDEAQRRFIGKWVSAADVEDRTVFANSRELTLREAIALADNILSGDSQREVSHALRNNVSLKSLVDVLVITACERIVQEPDSLVEGIRRFQYAQAVRCAISFLSRDPLWPLLSGVEFLREGWSGEGMTPFSLEMELADPDDFAKWAALQDGDKLRLDVHLFVHAFVREELTLDAELKPYLYRAANMVRSRVPVGARIQRMFTSLAG